MSGSAIRNGLEKSAIRRKIKKRGENIVENHPGKIIAAISVVTFLLLLVGFRNGILFTIIGVYLVIDGIGSILVYIKQSWIEHVPRLARAFAGLIILIMKWL